MTIQAAGAVGLLPLVYKAYESLQEFTDVKTDNPSSFMLSILIISVCGVATAFFTNNTMALMGFAIATAAAIVSYWGLSQAKALLLYNNGVKELAKAGRDFKDLSGEVGSHVSDLKSFNLSFLKDIQEVASVCNQVVDLVETLEKVEKEKVITIKRLEKKALAIDNHIKQVQAQKNKISTFGKYCCWKKKLPEPSAPPA